jgi:hypothetical protein
MQFYSGPLIHFLSGVDTLAAHLRQTGPAPPLIAPETRRKPRGFTPRYEIPYGRLKL